MANKQYHICCEVFIGVVLTFFLSGCTSIHFPFRKNVSDYSKRYSNITTSNPEQDTTSSRPVYLLPVIVKHYIQPHIDPTTGEWIGGHSSATVVEKERFATQEEAERLGRKYVSIDNNSSPIVPLPSSGQELNATTLAQKLASFNNTSLNNQVAGGNISSPPSDAMSKPTKESSNNIKVNFLVGKNALKIFPGGSDGDSFSVVTPRGPAKLKYDNGLVIINFRDQEQSVKQPFGSPIVVSLPAD